MHFTVFREKIKVFYVIVCMKSFLVNEINTRITLYSVQIPIQFSIMSIFRSRIIDLHVNFKNTIYDMYFTVFRENIKVFYVIVLRVSLHAGSQSSVLIPNYFSILSILRSRNVDLNLNFKNAICECNM